MADNTLEIIIKTSSKQAVTELQKVDKEVKKLGGSFEAYMSGLKKGSATTQDFQNMLLSSAKSAGLNNAQIIRMTQSSGLFSDSQLKSAQAMYQAQAKADQLAAAVARGDMTSRQAAKAFGDYTRTLGTTQDKLKGLVAGFGAYIAITGAVIAVGVKIGQQVKKLADGFMNYAFQVKDFGRIIGATPEEASKLIQVADDVRLSVESMTTAMRSAITKGHAPTIEGLGKLSDEYLAIQDPLERSRFLIERFGRSGLEMAKLMELGSKRIEEMGDGVEGTARLMTSQGIRAAEAYYTSLDKMGESIEDITLLLGSEFMPAISDAAGGLADFVNDGMGVFLMFKMMQRGFETGTLSLTEFMTMFGRYMRAEMTAEEIVANLTGEILAQDAALAPGKFQNLETSIAAYASAADGAAESTDGVTTSLEEAEEKARAFRQSIASLPENISMSFTLQIPDITTELSNLVNNKKWVESGGAAAAQFIEGLKGKLATLSAAELQGVAANLAAVELGAKVQIGQLSKAEAIAQIQQAFGLSYSEAALTVTAAIEADPDSPKEILDFLDAQIGANPLTATVQPEIDQAKYDAIFGSGPNGLTKPSEAVVSPKLDMAVYGSMVKTITKPLVIPVTIRYTTTGSPGLSIGEQEKLLGRDLNGNGVIGRATGGPVSPGQWYMVGERGPEMFMPNTPGRIIPNNQTTNNSPVNITNNFSVVASTALDIRELARQVAREQQRAGSK